MPRSLETLRICRGLDTTADWYTDFGLNLWERFGARLSLIEEPVTTIVGTGEMNEKLSKFKKLGKISVDHLVTRVRDDMPDSFGQRLSAKTDGLYVRPWSDGVRRLAIVFNDADLTAERQASVRALNVIAGRDLDWEGSYRSKLSVASIDQGEGITFRTIIKEMLPYVPDEVELLPGRIDKVVALVPISS